MDVGKGCEEGRTHNNHGVVQRVVREDLLETLFAIPGFRDFHTADPA